MKVEDGIVKDPKNEDDADAHVEGLPDGSGCTEIWEHLSERRAEEAEDR